jgi:transposase InsO family protein
MTHKEVIGFITEHIIHRFGMPQTLTTDQGTSFVAKQVHDFVKSYGIRLLNSSPYYAQANGQTESSNKALVKLIKKKVKDNPKNGMKYYLKRYGLITSLDMGLLKLLLLSLRMVKMPFYLSR